MYYNMQSLIFEKNPKTLYEIINEKKQANKRYIYKGSIYAMYKGQ